MGIFDFLPLKKRQNITSEGAEANRPAGRAIGQFETMESRRMLSANPIHIGITYFESDNGSDANGDQFEVTFNGGGVGTTLNRIIIDGDKGLSQSGNGAIGPQLINGDVFFDTVSPPSGADSGYGADLSSPFQIVSSLGIEVTNVTVLDGGTKLAIDFSGFESGEKLVFTIDVDEAFNPAFDPNNPNAGIDPVTSGIEFQGSHFTTEFTAPGFHDVSGNSVFLNQYDNQFAGKNLNLPLDDAGGHRDRTAGTAHTVQQQPKPITIEGTVYYDKNINDTHDLTEGGIGGVEIALYKLNTGGNPGDPADYTDTGMRQTTLANGDYKFGENLNLQPGTYRLVEAQPSGYLTYRSQAGTVDGSTTGTSGLYGGASNVISQIEIPNGGTAAIDYDFSEIKPVKVSGYVYHDRNDNGLKEVGEEGIAGVTLNIAPVGGGIPSTGPTSVVTDANGFYEFVGLNPGTEYRISEEQDSRYIDGKDTLGTVNTVATGSVFSNDVLQVGITPSEAIGVDYNFGELMYTEIHGNVHITDKYGDCNTANHDVRPYAGAVIKLYDSQGNFLSSTTTDSQGKYSFSQLMPGEYTVVEETPPGLIDGSAHAGSQGGAVQDGGRITQIQLASGDSGTDYNFCEHEPASLSGFVYHDRNLNGLKEVGEEGIAGVVVNLYDSQNNLVATQTTSSPNGAYIFTNLKKDTYTVVEVHPSMWWDGLDRAGEVDGITSGAAINPGDQIRQVNLLWGSNGENYNFGEYKPASIQGRVHVEHGENCEYDQGDQLLSGVTIELLDSHGQVIKTTTTDDQGEYYFGDLEPGNYSIREIQPTGYLHGGQSAGSGGGNASQKDLITNIDLTSGENVVHYNFCEVPTSSISGYVFQDGPKILSLTGRPPSDVSTIRDGQRTSDDRPLSGVVLELRNGTDGSPILGESLDSGVYANGPVRTVTDANGFYEFTGLPPGNYAVFEIQPLGFFDSIDTPGTTGGIPMNPHQVADPAIVNGFTTNGISLGTDAIVQIQLGAGVHSQENNFSEILVESPPPRKPPETPEEEPPPVIPPVIETPPRPELFGPPAPPEFEYYGGGGLINYTWHLSIIDGGTPRGSVDRLASATEQPLHTVSFMGNNQWPSVELQHARWILDTQNLQADDQSNIVEVSVTKREQNIFGFAGATPVSGDFNGDGISEMGLFYKGEWYLDLNGNGTWDEDDLWAQLGNEEDRPVVGDWDGDGKDDIGIFGPAWAGDPQAIETEPGLPDIENRLPRKQKNMPPEQNEATSGQRTMQFTSLGKPREDLIDHVFEYGSPEDAPIAGDFNGDGIATVGYYNNGTWQLDVNGDGQLTDEDVKFIYGQEGDLPVIGDFNNDGIDDVGVYRQGEWHLDTNGNKELDAHDLVFKFGQAGDLPVVGDWNGDGVDEPGLYQGGSGGEKITDLPAKTILR
ncbi:MAG: hypothetical protein MPJ24_09020 [Pirellulaceae bacterium]|nr:hypothetical protein [Pirellulaceae bacterium]